MIDLASQLPPLPAVLLLFVVAVVAGALNSVAGGGSFFSFPALVLTGVPPIPANASSTVALWPGSIASVGAYRKEVARQDRLTVIYLGLASFIGGFSGAFLLLRTPQNVFNVIVPFLLLLATLLFTFSPAITHRFGIAYPTSKKPSLLSLSALVLFQLAVSTYGGYFGGGMGLLMLAAFAVVGLENIHQMNALKTVLAVCINGVAVITFALAGIVVWPQALLMLVGAVLGGYSGAALARKIDPDVVRRFVVVVGCCTTVYFLARNFVLS